MSIRKTILLLCLSACGGAPFLPEQAPSDRFDAAEDSNVEAGSDVEVVEGGRDAGCTCVNDLSSAGLSDFYIAFTLRTTSLEPMSILNQHGSCSKPAAFWDVMTGTNGAYSPNEGVVYIQASDGATTLLDNSTQRTVNDGQAHRIVFARTAEGLTVTVDGVGTLQAGPPRSMGANLPPLQVGADPGCSYAPLSGELSDVCLTIGCPIK